MPTSEAKLIAMIEKAFDGVVLGDGQSLNMTEYADSGGCAPKYAQLAIFDERFDWRAIPDAVLERFEVTFCFTDLLGYRFYAAPYMIWTIKNHRDSNCFIADATVYAMDPTTFQFATTRFTEWFSIEQTNAILAFLDYCATNGDTLDEDVATRNAIAIRAELQGSRANNCG